LKIYVEKFLIYRPIKLSIFYFTKFGSIIQRNNETQQNRTEKNNKTRENGIDMQKISDINSSLAGNTLKI